MFTYGVIFLLVRGIKDVEFLSVKLSFFSRMQKLVYDTIYFCFSKFALNTGTLASLFNINQYQTSGICLLTFSAV